MKDWALRICVGGDRAAAGSDDWASVLEPIRLLEFADPGSGFSWQDASDWIHSRLDRNRIPEWQTRSWPELTSAANSSVMQREVSKTKRFTLDFHAATSYDRGGQPWPRSTSYRREQPWITVRQQGFVELWFGVWRVLPGEIPWNLSFFHCPCAPGFLPVYQVNKLTERLTNCLFEMRDFSRAYLGVLAWEEEITAALASLDSQDVDHRFDFVSQPIANLLSACRNAPPLGCMGCWDDVGITDPATRNEQQRIGSNLADLTCAAYALASRV